MIFFTQKKKLPLSFSIEFLQSLSPHRQLTDSTIHQLVSLARPGLLLIVLICSSFSLSETTHAGEVASPAPRKKSNAKRKSSDSENNDSGEDNSSGDDVSGGPAMTSSAKRGAAGRARGSRGRGRGRPPKNPDGAGRARGRGGKRGRRS